MSSQKKHWLRQSSETRWRGETDKKTFQNRFERVKDILASSFFSQIYRQRSFCQNGGQLCSSGSKLVFFFSTRVKHSHKQRQGEGVHDHDKRLISLSKAVSQGTSLSHLMARGYSSNRRETKDLRRKAAVDDQNPPPPVDDEEEDD